MSVIETMSFRALMGGAALLSVLLLAARAGAQLDCGEFVPGLFPYAGADRLILDLAEFDDGAGPALFAAGQFSVMGNSASYGIARFDGTSWESVGSGLAFGSYISPVISRLHAHDDGTGPALYAGGVFDSIGGIAASYIARWDGRAWSAVGNAVRSPVYAMATFDESAGPRLFVASTFVMPDGSPHAGVARWDGAAWSAVGDPFEGQVLTLEVFDDGRGPALFAGGNFLSVGGVAAPYVARWDGSEWSSVGPPADGAVRDLAVCNHGVGPRLIAVGDFLTVGGTPALRVAAWDGLSWSPLGSGANASVDRAKSVGLAPDQRLLVFGNFTSAGGVPTRRAASWNGSTWGEVGDGIGSGSILCAAEFEIESERTLYVGGAFDSAGSSLTKNIAILDGDRWIDAFRGFAGGVSDIVVHDDGRGAALFAAGDFTITGEPRIERIARWDGREWSAVDTTGIDGDVYDIEIHDAGSGPDMYIGGSFTRVGGVEANRVARWDGGAWAPVGSGTDGPVRALESHDADGRPALFAGGAFASPGLRLAWWDNDTWHPIDVRGRNQVRDLLAFDDGSGRSLFVATDSGVWKWDGNRISAVGSAFNGWFNTLETFDDGNGQALFAGGVFSFVGGVPANNIARWDGAVWSPLGDRIYGSVVGLGTFDDGAGELLYLGAYFAVLAWDGRESTYLGEASSYGPESFHAFEYEGAPVLMMGGSFTRIGGVASHGLAMWRAPCAGCIEGTVNAGVGPIVDVLYVNDTSGGDARRVSLATYEPLRVFMASPPAALGGVPFALYAWRGEPSDATARTLALGIGRTCMPTPLSPGPLRPRVIWNNTGRAILGAPSRPSSPAPSVVLDLRTGAGRRGAFFLQGIIADPGSRASVPASVTNGVIVVTN